MDRKSWVSGYLWSAGCEESRTPGAEGGSEKRAGSNPGVALRPNPRHSQLMRSSPRPLRCRCTSLTLRARGSAAVTSKYRAIKYAERLDAEDAVASVGSQGDSYDNAMPRRLMHCSRPSWSGTRARGGTSTTSRSPSQNGWTGTTSGPSMASSAHGRGAGYSEDLGGEALRPAGRATQARSLVKKVTPPWG